MSPSFLENLGGAPPRLAGCLHHWQIGAIACIRPTFSDWELIIRPFRTRSPKVLLVERHSLFRALDLVDHGNFPSESNPRDSLDQQGTSEPAPKKIRMEPSGSTDGAQGEGDGEVRAGHVHYDPMADQEPAWRWPKHLETYAAPLFKKYIPENVIARVMKETPMAANEFLRLPSVDPNLLRRLNRQVDPKLATKMTGYDREVATLQAKTLRITAPLGELYCALDSAIRGQGDLKLSEVMMLVEKTILLTGQANNACLYARRMNVLKQVVGTSKDANEALNNYKDMLYPENDLMFGMEFQKQVFAEEHEEDGFASMLPARQPFQQEPGARAQGPGAVLRNDFHSNNGGQGRGGRGGNNNSRGRGGNNSRGRGGNQNSGGRGGRGGNTNSYRSVPSTFTSISQCKEQKCDSLLHCSTEFGAGKRELPPTGREHSQIPKQLGDTLHRQGNPNHGSRVNDRMG